MQRVSRSTIIHAPIEQVWAVLRDFNSHDQWHSAIASSHIEGRDRSDQVGCVRSFTLKDGNRIREQLIALDDVDHRSTYCIVESTVPLQRYVATVTLKPVTDSQSTFWQWESTFQTPAGMERELGELVAQGVYEAGFGDLRRHLELGADRQAPGASHPVSQTQALPVPSRRVVLKQYGEPHVMSTETAEAPSPGPGEVRIAQRAIGVNFFDIYLRRGWMPDLLPLPGTPGMEAAGAIIDVGPGVTELMPGDRVAYLGPQPGSYASVRTVPSAWVVRLPPTVEDASAAALLLKGCTADFLLRDLGHVRPGTRLLVHGAAGGLGLLVCAWARHMGATVIGTVSSEPKARAARQAGCQHVVITTNYRFAREVQHLGGAQVIVDGLGGAAASENLEALARAGHWISVGQASGPLPTLSPDALVAKSATFSRPVVFDYVATPAALAERAQRVWQALADGTLPAPQIERYSLDAADQAHQRLESRGVIGSLVLLP
jgi:NADPH:quinone reductase-like Zn-dependent oxidoreductase